jgi:hypothetical protein
MFTNENNYADTELVLDQNGNLMTRRDYLEWDRD